MEKEKQAAMSRMQVLTVLQQKIERGELPTKDEVVAAINKVEVDMDTMKKDSSEAGRKVACSKIVQST